MSMSVLLKVGHYQCQCSAGNYDANIAKVIAGLKYADAEGVDIMTFPESFLTGYFDSKEKMQAHSWELDSPQIKKFLQSITAFNATCIVGFNEKRGEDYYNTVLVAEKGRIIGTYSKAFPCSDHHKPGRSFPVFEKKGIKYGVVICADGAYIEPCRILALKGARIIFAPHYNYIAPEHLIGHFQKVRNDHIARAVENGIWFLRANSVTIGRDSGLSFDGVGYGDSYLIDPSGQMVVASQRHTECFMNTTIKVDDDYLQASLRTRKSAVELGKELLAVL